MDYVDLLVADLCRYYSYEKFLMQKFFELFPVNEVIIGSHLLHWGLSYLTLHLCIQILEKGVRLAWDLMSRSRMTLHFGAKAEKSKPKPNQTN